MTVADLRVHYSGFRKSVATSVSERRLFHSLTLVAGRFTGQDHETG
jgi:hypothetical protein